MAQRCMTRKGSKWSIAIGSALLTIALAALIIFPFAYQQILRKELSLVDNSLALNIWKDIPIPIYLKIYYFNITNADAFLQNKEPLNVTEMGPYTYKVRLVKKDHFWNSNSTISFRETRTYEFMPDMSAGSEDDNVTTLNGPMILAAAILKDYNLAMRVILALAMKLKNEEIIIQKSVRQLTFEGYEDPLIKYAPILKPNIPFKNGIFAYLNGKNASDDGLFTAFTGETNSSLTNTINNWNGNEKLPYWKTKDCSDLKGATNVEYGPPLEEDPGSYTFFQTLLCRPLTFNYTGDEMHYGVLTKRFMSTKALFENSTENPDNICFEVNKERKSGILDISPCQFGAPILISNPHFYMADPSYLDKVNGLSPNSSLHYTNVDVEPITGFTLVASIKFQMNIEMERVKGILEFNSAPEGIFPIFWLEIQVQVTESWADFLKGQLNNPKIIAYTLIGFLLLLSLTLLIGGIVILRSYSRDSEKEHLITDNQNECNKSVSNTGYMSGYGNVIENPTVQSDPFSHQIH